jgi:hypothetical protein
LTRDERTERIKYFEIHSFRNGYCRAVRVLSLWSAIDDVRLEKSDASPGVGSSPHGPDTSPHGDSPG